MAPLDLGHTIDAALKIVQRRWRTLAVLVLLVAGPLQVASVAITAATTDSWTLSSAPGGQPHVTYGDQGAFLAGQTAIIALTMLSFLLGTVACYRAIADDVLGRPTGVRASLAFAVDRLGRTLWLTILLAVAVITGLVAFVVPGIWLIVALSVALPVMLVESVGGVAALRRSYELTKDRWWATAGRLLVAAIMVYVATTAATLAMAAIATAVVDRSSVTALVLSHVGDLAASLITTPFAAAVVVLVYFDLRARKERFDPGRPEEAAPEAGPEESFGGWLPPSPS